MSGSHKIKLNFVPEEYWDIYVTALERHKSLLIKKVFTQSGILLIVAALILGLIGKGVKYLLFKGGFEVLMLILVFGCGYLIYEIAQIISELQEIDIPQVKADTLDFIDRNKDVESAYLTYDVNDFLLELDNEVYRHHWDELSMLRMYSGFIYLEWEEINFVFGQRSMNEEEYNDFHFFLENKL